MIGTNSTVATPDVTSSLNQQLTALKAVDAAVKSGNSVLAQKLVEGLWDQGVPPDMIDKAREIVGLDPLCFPAFTPIAVSLTETRSISDIRVGDTVLAFDATANLGRGPWSRAQGLVLGFGGLVGGGAGDGNRTRVSSLEG